MAHLKKMRFKSQSELPMNGEGYFWSHEELCSRRGQVVEVVIPLVLSSGNPEWLDVDLAEDGQVPRSFLQRQNHLGRIFIHELNYLFDVPPNNGLVVDLKMWQSSVINSLFIVH